MTKKTPPAYGLSDGPIIVACQWNISSATGPVKGQRHAFKSDFDTLKLQYQFFIQADESFTTQLKTVLHCVHTEACWSCQCHSSILMAKKALRRFVCSSTTTTMVHGVNISFELYKGTFYLNNSDAGLLETKSP